MNAPVIFDFDDSIWLNDTSDGNKELAWIKKPQKTALICGYADLVTVGNQYLFDFAKQYNENVVIIPTLIDTDYHKPAALSRSNERVCIGWTGTATTLKQYCAAIPMLQEIKRLHGDKVYFKVIANVDVWSQDLEVKLTKWSKENEIEELSEFDIGIMPLPDDLWSKGKCGFKGLQCMALEIPVVMSPVGVNVEIIQHGVNGFLATDTLSWVESLSKLIDSKELRESVGKEGRKTVCEKYSVNAYRERFLQIFDTVKKLRN